MVTLQDAVADLRRSVVATRMEAAHFLAKHPSSQVERPLVAALSDTAWEVRNAVAFALGQLEQPTDETTKALSGRAKTDSNAYVRKSCCYALGASGDVSLAARLALQNVLKGDRDIGVRCAAAQALERGGGDLGFKFLAQALRHEDERTRFEAFTNLGMLGLLPGDWMNDPRYMQLLQTPAGRDRLVEAAATLRGQRSVETVTTDEFIDRARREGLPFVGVSLAYETDEFGNVRKFDFVLMAPVDTAGAAQTPGTVQHVGDVRFSQGPLARVLGMDDDGTRWFPDGPRLQVAPAYLSKVRRFTQQGGQQTTARARVGEFFNLLERIDAAGLKFQILGSGLQPLLAWAEAVHGDG